MISYWEANYNVMMKLMIEHARMVWSAILIALVLAVVIIAIFIRKENWLNSLVYFFSLLYSVPSYAFFALLIPLTGLGEVTAIIVLAFYCEYVILRSFITGIQEVNPNYIEVAKGVGMTQKETLIHVQIPQALPSVFSGLQVTLSSAMAIATIASTISAGGLGDLMFEGLQTGQIVPILWGTILTVILTLIGMLIIKLIENIMISDWYDAEKA